MDDKEVESWESWIQRMSSQTEEMITPGNRLVEDEVRKAGIDRNNRDINTALKVWRRVRDIIEYQENGKTKTPEKTILDGKGDCKDITFLTSSMLINAGVYDTRIQAGTIRGPDGEEERHCWNVVWGKVIDPTGDTDQVATLDYTKKAEMDIEVVGKV